MTVSASPQKNGAASAATDPRHGSTNPAKDIKNMDTLSTAEFERQLKASSVHLDRAANVVADAQNLIHAAWMAADGIDVASTQDAIRSVLHIAGERLSDAFDAIQREQIGRAS